MPGTGSPTVRRREFGVRVRALRNQRGWTVEYVANRLLCSSSKVSRLETGHRGASVRDVRDLCDLYEVGEEQRELLTVLAQQGKERAWWLPLNLPYSTYVGLEAEAALIRDYGVGMVPGLLQTADYARAVVQAAGWAPSRVDQWVKGRMARQRILTEPGGPRFEAMIDESVLHRVVGSPAVMAGQLTRLLQASEKDRICLRVIPYGAGALPAVNKFIILSFAAATVPEVVMIEGLTAELFVENAEDVEVYVSTFRALSELAASAERSRAMIASVIEAYRSGSG
jgi:transcriptional regulator with XRE-family HTH domain